jgi:hypothetical protein
MATAFVAAITHPCHLFAAYGVAIWLRAFWQVTTHLNITRRMV